MEHLTKSIFILVYFVKHLDFIQSLKEPFILKLINLSRTKACFLQNHIQGHKQSSIKSDTPLKAAVT